MSCHNISKKEIIKINTIIKRINKKDESILLHSLFVANVVKEYAQSHNEIEEDEETFLYYTGLLHDVGKIYISDYILFKPKKLSKLEYKIVSLHAFFGYLYLRINLPKQKKMAKLILNHHNKKTNDLYNNILVAADVYCALKEERCYKTAMKYSEIERIFNDENIVPEIRNDFLSRLQFV